MQADNLFIYLFPSVNKTMDLAKTKKQWIWHPKKKKTMDIGSPRNQSSTQGTNRDTTKAKA